MIYLILLNSMCFSTSLENIWWLWYWVSSAVVFIHPFYSFCVLIMNYWCVLVFGASGFARVNKCEWAGDVFSAIVKRCWRWITTLHVPLGRFAQQGTHTHTHNLVALLQNCTGWAGPKLMPWLRSGAFLYCRATLPLSPWLSLQMSWVTINPINTDKIESDSYLLCTNLD